jgi:hypothetical protein
MAKLHCKQPKLKVVERNGSVRAVKLALVEPDTWVNEETVLLLESLLAQAKQGELQGVAMVTFQQGGYELFATGLGATARTFAAGAIAKLHAETVERIEI